MISTKWHILTACYSNNTFFLSSAVDTVGNRKVAIKQIKILSETSYQLKKVYREFHLMKLCYYHPGVSGIN